MNSKEQLHLHKKSRTLEVAWYNSRTPLLDFFCSAIGNEEIPGASSMLIKLDSLAANLGVGYDDFPRTILLKFGDRKWRDFRVSPGSAPNRIEGEMKFQNVVLGITSQMTTEYVQQNYAQERAVLETLSTLWKDRKVVLLFDVDQHYPATLIQMRWGEIGK